MDIDGQTDRETRPMRVYAEEDKEDEGTAENTEIGLGTVVVV
jgi:hypothetical protein